MNQQINLYRPVFRKQEKKFSAKAMLQAGAAMVIGVVAIYAMLLWQLSGARSELVQAEKRHADTTKRVEDASKKFGPAAKNQLLEDEIVKLERSLAARQRIQAILDRGLFSNTRGYSDYFVALARQHVTGVWVTGVDISGAGETMKLQGRTVDPAQVPRYVQRLSAEETLAGKEFQVFVMSRPLKEGAKDPEPYVDFVFKTGREKEQPKP